ncbi:MAG TPA: hypothetical protein VLV50_09375 [Stellaceae bacterium]|nr:hypothetical protein [Stellaceae bacterium]
MASHRAEVIVPYGRAVAQDAGPALSVAAGAALRLSDGPYPFAEPPDLVRATSVADRLEILREQLASLCGPWDRLAALFLDCYVEWIAATLATADAELRDLSARAGGIFAPEDWSFSALRPLPQAHLPAGTASVRADFAFWTGTGFVAIDLQGNTTPRRQRRAELQSLADAGAHLVAVPGAALQQERISLLGRVLPPELQRFWAGVLLPASPFGPSAEGFDLPP